MSLVIHTIEPVYDCRSGVLVLGTMPSPRSRELGFYYGHPQNRFWPTLSAVVGEALPRTNEQKAALVLRHGIALWDVLKSCEIDGASDASIRSPVPNDLGLILRAAPICAVFTTGRKAYELYNRHCFGTMCSHAAVCLPSTSPANRRVTDAELVSAYAQILQYL